MVFMYGVISSPGVLIPASRARRRSAVSSSAPCSAPSATTTSSKASIHSAISSEKLVWTGTASFVLIDRDHSPVGIGSCRGMRGTAWATAQYNVEWREPLRTQPLQPDPTDRTQTQIESASRVGVRHMMDRTPEDSGQFTRHIVLARVKPQL